MKLAYVQWIQDCSYKKIPFLYPLEAFIIIDTHKNLY